MSCPDRLTLFIGVEEHDPVVKAHLEGCERCCALAEAELELDSALERVRDPAPPSDLLANVLRRVDDAEALARAGRRQTVGIVLTLLAVLSGALFAAGPAWFLESALDGVALASSARTAVGALGRSFPGLGALLMPVVVAQALALVAATLLLNRLLALRVRS